MMSVPMPTCTVTGISSRAAAASDAEPLVRRRCARAATRRPPGRSRGRAPTPSLIAAFSSRPVSSAMPKRPGPSASSTSSEVDPDSASSKSWMTAGAVGGERRHEAALHQIDQHRPEPGLDDVRAEAPDHATAAVERGAHRRDDRPEIRRRRGSRAATRATPRIPLPGTYGWRSPRRSPCSRATRADRCARRTDRTLRREASSEGLYVGARQRPTSSSNSPNASLAHGLALGTEFGRADVTTPSDDQHRIPVAVEPIALATAHA